MTAQHKIAGVIYATVSGLSEECFHILPENRKEKWLIDADRVINTIRNLPTDQALQLYARR